MQSLQAFASAHPIDSKQANERSIDCIIHRASDVPAAGDHSGQPRKSRRRQEHTPTERPSRKGMTGRSSPQQATVEKTTAHRILGRPVTSGTAKRHPVSDGAFCLRGKDRPAGILPSGSRRVLPPSKPPTPLPFGEAMMDLLKVKLPGKPAGRNARIAHPKQALPSLFRHPSGCSAKQIIMASDHPLSISPLSLACPHCGANPREECESTSLFAIVHVARIKAAIRSGAVLLEKNRPKGEAA